MPQLYSETIAAAKRFGPPDTAYGWSRSLRGAACDWVGGGGGGALRFSTLGGGELVRGSFRGALRGSLRGSLRGARVLGSSLLGSLRCDSLSGWNIRRSTSRSGSSLSRARGVAVGPGRSLPELDRSRSVLPDRSRSALLERSRCVLGCG